MAEVNFQKPVRQRMVQILRRALPILISALILFYYFRRVKWEELYQALSNANLWIFFPARIIPLIFYLIIDAYLLQRLLVWFHSPISYSAVLYGRAGLYILSLINPQASNGGMFLYLMRRAKIGAEKLLGLVIFRFSWSVWSINFAITVALLVLYLMNQKVQSPFNMKIIYITVGMIWLSLFLCLGLVYYLRRFHTSIGERALLRGFFEAKAKHYLETAILTLVLALSGLLSNYFCARSFGLKIPLPELIVFLPIADIISTLPIAFAGLGTTTFAWQNLFGTYGTKETILFYSIALPVVTYLTRAFLGVITLFGATKEFQKLFNQSPDSRSDESAIQKIKNF